jgi:peptidoglycan/xylan/chitin deacetylase (PgdA/CDA1 family)
MMLSKYTILQKERWPAFDGKIILTFDDGPNGKPDVSEALLDVLSRRGVRATFCYIGENIDRFPETAKRAFEDGHRHVLRTDDGAYQVPAIKYSWGSNSSARDAVSKWKRFRSR